MPEGSITRTSIDALVDYLKVNGEVDVPTLAKALGVSETLIEEWSNILEKSNIVKISYKAAKMYVAPIAVTKESITEVQHGIEIKKESLINEVNAQLSTINQLNQRIDELSKFIQQGKEIFNKRVGPLKSNLDELYKMSTVAEKKYNIVKEKKNEIDIIAKKLGKEIEGLKEMSSTIEHFQMNSADAEKLIEDMQNKIKLMEKMLEEEILSRKKAIALLEENEKKLTNSIKNEISILNDMISANKKSFEEDKKVSAEYKKKVVELRNKLGNIGTKAVNEVMKDKEEMDRYSNMLEAKYIKFMEEIDNLKKSMGDVTKIDEILRNAQQTIEDSNKEKNKLIEELNKILVEAKAVDSISKEDIVSSSKKIDELEGKTNAINRKVNDIGEKVSEAKSGLDNLA
ncbi:MAG: hypothetical protein ACP5RT_00600 [Candidatus Micrarchaeia archaeon]